VKVLPASDHNKKVASSSMMSSGADSLMLPVAHPKKGIVLHIPLRKCSYESANSLGGTPRDSIHSMPSRPMDQYVFPRSPKNMKVAREVTS
jgi:hypothetical protein